MYDEFDKDKNWFLNYLKNPDNFFKNSLEKLKNMPSRLEAIWRGGMPGIIDIPNSALPFYFSSYVQTYVERDIRTLENIGSCDIWTVFRAAISIVIPRSKLFSIGKRAGHHPKNCSTMAQVTYLHLSMDGITTFSHE